MCDKIKSQHRGASIGNLNRKRDIFAIFRWFPFWTAEQMQHILCGYFGSKFFSELVLQQFPLVPNASAQDSVVWHQLEA